MRALALIGLLVLAGCGDSGTPPKSKAARAAALEPGQWELVSEVTGVDRADEGAPKIDTPVGTRATESVCVGAAGRPPAALFAGAGFDCDYGNYYLRGGRVNVSLLCRRAGLAGTVPMMVEGSFEARTLTYNRNLRTILSTEGDVEIDARVTGRRTGDCAPGGEGGGEAK